MIQGNANIAIVVVHSFSMRITLKKANRLIGLKFFIKIVLNTFYCFALFYKLRKLGIDVVHINGLNHTMGATVAKWLNVPCVWHIRQFLEDDQGLKLYHEEHVWRTMSKADGIIAISDSVKEKFEGKINHPIDVIRNGVPVTITFKKEAYLNRNMNMNMN